MAQLAAVLGLSLILGSSDDKVRTVGAILAGAGVNDMLREHRDTPN